jgi:hypothetical protein
MVQAQAFVMRASARLALVANEQPPGSDARHCQRGDHHPEPLLTDAQKVEVKQRMDEFVSDRRLEFFLDLSLDAVAAALAASG